MAACRLRDAPRILSIAAKEQGMTTATTAMVRPVIFGEVLFDRFPDGQAVLGGAPFNVAWHLKGFGLNPLFISRVGRDAAGEDVLACMKHWGMDLRGVQHDAGHPTGAVEVTLHDGQPRFEILPDQAYDHIESEPALALLEGARQGVLYMGSLITRGARSRASLDSLLRRQRFSVFVDINLRPPWWDLARVEGALGRARWVKLNEDELAEISGKPLDTPEEVRAQADLLRTRFDLELVILTQGSQGADFITASEHHHGDPVPVTELVDTVGAGDAFSSVTLLGLLLDWPRELILQRSLAFASRICAQRGATADDRELYAGFRREWRI